jgi:hypothetical protein
MKLSAPVSVVFAALILAWVNPPSSTGFRQRIIARSHGLLWRNCYAAAFAVLLALFLPVAARSEDWMQLQSQKNLTPEGLMRYFADFSFELGAQVQDPATFIRRKRGDCDDFANLAATLLTNRGYEPKLVVVMMEKQTHVVCYVKEAQGFLDYNHRAEPHPIVASDGSLEDIATKVAAYFRSRWRMASEFKYQNNATIFLDSTFPSAARNDRSGIATAQ